MLWYLSAPVSASTLGKCMDSTTMHFRHHDMGGSGPTLLMLHANGFHGRAFGPLARHLGSSFNCVALDLPGHGDACEAALPATWLPSALAEAMYQYLCSMGLTGEETNLSQT